MNTSQKKINRFSKPIFWVFWVYAKNALLLITLLSVLTGIIYPLLITGIAQLLFPKQANGSLIMQKQKIIGSELLGQSFQDPKYFWGRPSATKPYPYNAAASSASNLGPSNLELQEKVKDRVQQLQQAYPMNPLNIPIDLVTSSGSGLDPHISLESALYQVGRVAKIRNISEEQLKVLINKYLEKRQLGFLGRERINVLKLNLALDLFQLRGTDFYGP